MGGDLKTIPAVEWLKIDKKRAAYLQPIDFIWWRGQDLNLRPSGYEPDELPDCSTPLTFRLT